MTTRSRRAGAFVAWVALLGGAAAVLQLAGAALPSPPLTAPSRWSDWLSDREPVVVAFSVLRLLALALAWYSLVVTVAGALARLLAAADLAAGRSVRVTQARLDRLTLRPLRRVLAGTMSVGISTASLTPVAAGAVSRPAAVATAEDPTNSTTTVTAPPVDSLTMRELPSLSEARPPAREPPPARSWTVRPGEWFWSIAEDVLVSTLGRHPTVGEVVPYWRSLVETNRAALADRDNADLVFPGQVFTVPDPPRG